MCTVPSGGEGGSAPRGCLLQGGAWSRRGLLWGVGSMSAVYPLAVVAEIPSWRRIAALTENPLDMQECQRARRKGDLNSLERWWLSNDFES